MTKNILPHSTPNQKILDQLINREVFCNMNQEMDFILSALAYDASIPEDPPFDESDYESAICDASSQTCSECGNSSYFDEVGVPTSMIPNSKTRIMILTSRNLWTPISAPSVASPTLLSPKPVPAASPKLFMSASVAVLSTVTMNTMTSTPPARNL